MAFWRETTPKGEFGEAASLLMSTGLEGSIERRATHAAWQAGGKKWQKVEAEDVPGASRD